MRTQRLTQGLLVWAVLAVASASAQSLDWATPAGGTDVDSAEAVGVDANGNSYVVGAFRTQATFGTGGPGEIVLSSAGAVPSQDIFIAKYGADGALVWARGIGGTDPASGGDAGTDLGQGIAVDALGNSHVTGSLYRFTSLADLGAGVTLTSPGAFAAKYDAAGQAIWATALDVTGIGWAIAVDGSGNACVTGQAADPLLGGSIPTIWRVDAAGTVLWTRQAPGGGGSGTAVTADGAGCTVGGRFAGTTTFGSEAAQAVLTAGNGTGEGFLARYDAAGTLVWARQTLSDGGAWAEGIDADLLSNSYVTGTLNGNTTFGPGEPNETTLTSSHVGDMFLAKYDNLGRLVWVEHGPGSFNASGMAVAVDGLGASHVTGYFGLGITFDAGQPTETTLNGLGGGDVFVAKFDTNGVLEWARQAGGTGDPFGDWGTGIDLDGGGNASVVGFFQSMATFGTGETRETTLTSAGQSDVFVARYANNSAPPAELDLDISQFRATNRAVVSRGGLVALSLTVRNAGSVAGTAIATVVGVQAGVQVYSETILVADGVGNGRTTFAFPDFHATTVGEITWTATIDDVAADVDEASALTRVVP